MTDDRFSPVRLVKLAVASLMLAALAACATPFKANVQRFSAQLPAPQGQTFAVVAEDKAMAGGLEFSQYASLVTAKMQALGYVPASDPAKADMVVRFDYGVDKGREKVRSTGYVDPFWSPWYGFGRSRYWGPGYYSPYRPSRMWGWGWYDPWFDQGYESYTVFISGISLKIDRQDGQRLFEGRAEAASTSNRLQYLVPNLVEAMFTDFPGHNGETVRISVAPEKKKN
ncbi:DUF4136 domain-containing protein [Novosphingobium sp.]|uniref:DUF4136 domain-containing protein n=1 Tax=Novosphingobium sp. TaxID=1874826 RepID=UPI002600BC6C|nr:DUF4136 domain-containing protein [Novosphingobium sp.]MCC6924435.1 DUF4136 domain-containing protein [Novosphingobium sp.]